MPTLHHAGCDLAYQLRGEGPPVVLIQGVGLHEDGWLPQVAELSGAYADLSFDNRGMASSQLVETKELSVELMATDARLGQLGDIPTLVVGASEDPLSTPAIGRCLANGIAGVRYHGIAGAAHGVTVTHSVEINALLLNISAKQKRNGWSPR